MYNYFNFNGVQVNDLALVTKIEKPYIPANTVSTINVTSRDGEIFDGSIYKPITIKISLAIIGYNKDDYITRVKILKDLLCTRKEVPIGFTDNVSIYGILNSEFTVEQKNAVTGYADIEILCNDPYSYSDYVLTYNTEGESNELNLVQQGGTTTYPFVTIGVSKDTHFIQLQNKSTGEKILVGNYPKLENNESKKESDLVLHDTCTDLSKLTIAGANIDANRSYNGTFGISVSGNSYKLADMGSGTTKYKGACGRIALPKNLDQFKAKIKLYSNSSGKNGDPNIYDPDVEKHKEEVKSGKKVTYYVVNCTGLNYRTGPGTNYTSKGTLPYGYEIRKDFTIADGWCKFKYKTKTYYCSAKYLTKMVEDNTKSEWRTYNIENVWVLPDEGTKTNAQRAVYDSPGGSVVGYVPYGTKIRCLLKTYDVKDSDGKVKNSYYYMWKPYTNSKGVKVQGYIEKSVIKRSIDMSGDIVDYTDDPGYADDKLGTVEVYGFNINGSQIFKISLFDDNPYFEYSQPEVRVGSKVILKDTKRAPTPKEKKVADQNKVISSYYLGGRYGDWNNSDIYLTLTRKKSGTNYVWEATAQKQVDGKVVKTQTARNIKGKDLPTDELSYLAIYIGTSAATMNKCAGMVASDIKIYDISGSQGDKEADIIYFNAGDVIDLDFENCNCYVNKELRNDLVDIGSKYFGLTPGKSTLILNSDDTNASVSAALREKWLGVKDDITVDSHVKVIKRGYPIYVEPGYTGDYTLLNED